MILPPEIEELIAALRGEIASLRAEVAELKRRLGQDSSTSSKPPSSGGLAKKPADRGQPSRGLSQAERRTEGP